MNWAHWNPEISLGNVLTILGGLVVGIRFYIDFYVAFRETVRRTNIVYRWHNKVHGIDEDEKELKA